MRRTPSARGLPQALLALALAVFTFAASTAAAQSWEEIPPNPAVSVAYLPPKSADLTEVYQRLKDRKVLEEYQRFLAPLHLPHPLQLIARECGQPNAYYQPANRSLNLCYEYVGYFAKNAPETVSEDGFITRQAAIIGALISTLLHESGHMAFDMLDVPVFGREEDAADEMASFIAIQFNKDVARTVVKGLAYKWAKSRSKSPDDPMTRWADEHGSSSQRMYNALCLGYGGDPQTFQDFIDRGWLPKARAEHCADEFAQLRFAFIKTILPFIDQGLMAKVKQTQWLTAEELK